MSTVRDPFATGVVVHTQAFRLRRFLNWFPLGLTYAFLYMGRYNLTVAKNELGSLMTKEDFGIIFGIGTATYAIAFLLNGPLTDRFGGKKAILVAALGSGFMNLLMGLFTRSLLGSEDPGSQNLRLLFSILYAANMYFQSFGAVAIVKVNASWFHVKERGGFSGIFGTMISMGIFFAFTVNGWIVDLTRTSSGESSPWWVFFAPAIVLGTMFVVELFLLKDRPSLAGHEDIDTGDGDDPADGKLGTLVILRRILTHPVILVVAFIELCTGVLRNGVMHWFPIYSKEVWVLPSHHWLRHGNWGHLSTILPFFGLAIALFVIAGLRSKAGKPAKLFWSLGGVAFLIPFMQGGWGGILMVAGVIGGNVAGWLSDMVFQSRRAPVAAILYGLLCVSAVGMFFSLGSTTNEVAWVKEGKTQLQVGDRILKVEGKAVTDWSEVSKAVACMPARCARNAVWDLDRCACSTKPHRSDASVVASGGPLHLQISRGEGASKTELTLNLPDLHATMHAGDRRTLPAGPVLPLSPLWLGIIVFMMSLGVIGTHGLLSGTATMDFGGRRGAATAVGMIDGFVYLGTAIQSFSLGWLTTQSWRYWPIFLLPFGLLGLFLLTRIWHAVPTGKKAATP